MEIITAITASLELLKKLKEVSKNIKDAEIKNLIADISNQLADTKLAAVALKQEIIALKEENAELKAQKEKKEEPKVKWGCYYFEDDPEQRLYCPTCYDTKGIKVLTTRATSNYRLCNNCNSPIGSG